MWKTLALAGLVLLGDGVPAPPALPGGSAMRAPFTLYPVDLAAEQPGLLAAREAMRQAVTRRDVAALLALVADDIVVTVAEDRGKAAFKAAWGLDAPETSPLWSELATVLALGGSFEDGIFTAPYVTSIWPTTVDAVTNVAVIVPDAPLYAAPATDALVIRHLRDFDILRLETTAEPVPEGWRKVRDDNARIGFVRADHVRSPLDYRAGFAQVDGSWRMIFFVAGD